MVEEQIFNNNKIKVRCHTYSQRELAEMTPERLASALKSVERQQRLWNQDVRGKPAWFNVATRQSRNALARERRHIMRELELRAEQLQAHPNFAPHPEGEMPQSVLNRARAIVEAVERAEDKRGDK